MKPSFKITGSDAIRLAERDNLTIRCNGTPATVSPGEARGMLAMDGAESVWIAVTFGGWWDGQRVSAMVDGYNVADYFNSSGMFLGPDDDGVEPTWDDAVSEQSSDVAKAEAETERLRAEGWTQADFAAALADEILGR